MKNEIIQTKLLFPEILWKRPTHFYKVRGGKVFILAGSPNKAGSAIVTSEAVFRSGTGVITLGFPEGLKNVYKGLIPEAMSLPLTETPGYTVSKKAEKEILDHCEVADCVIIGPGLSANAETQHLTWQLIFDVKKTLVLEGDGIKAFLLGVKILFEREQLDGVKKYLEKRNKPTILILDTKELSIFLKNIGYLGHKGGLDSLDKSKKRGISCELASTLGVYIVLINEDITFYCPDKRVLINKFQGKYFPNKSKEVLSGVISSFVAQNKTKIFEAISTAIYIYCLATNRASENTERMSPSDIVKNLSKAILDAENEI